MIAPTTSSEKSVKRSSSRPSTRMPVAMIMERQQQHAQPDHQDQAHHPAAQQLVEIGFVARRLPDHVQRVFDLGEEAASGDHQGQHADQAAGQGVAGVADMQDGELHHVGAFRAHDPGKLFMHRAWLAACLAQAQRGDGAWR